MCNDKLAIHARLASNGEWKMLFPCDLIKVKKKFLFFKWTNTEYKPINLADAIIFAKECYKNDKYQDVVILKNNIDPEGYHTYCASCIWENGKWCNYSVRTAYSYNYNGY